MNLFKSEEQKQIEIQRKLEIDNQYQGDVDIFSQVQVSSYEDESTMEIKQGHLFNLGQSGNLTKSNLPITANMYRSNERLAGKEGKKAKKEYVSKRKQLKDDGLPVSLEDQKSLEKIIRGEWGRDEWMQEKHKGFTNIEIIRQINSGDNSNFENLDKTLRNLAATKYMEKWMLDEDYKGLIIQNNYIAIVNKLEEKEQGNGEASLFNPLLRLGLSQFARAAEKDGDTDNVYRKIDNEIARRIMVRTLTHKTTQEEKEKLIHMESLQTSLSQEQCAQTVETRIRQNTAKQSQMAKQLLMMQLGKLQIITGKDENIRTKDVSIPMASMMAHCSRTMVITPNVGEGQLEQHEDTMWSSILMHHHGDTDTYVNDANIFKRGGSTHSLQKRKIGGRFGKEKKVWPTNLFGQTGMNVAIGGLGAKGVDGKTLNNDGSCGHVYGMHKKSDAGSYGAYLFGYESDEYKHTNQLGHQHDLAATGEYASSFGSQRIDEVGNKYGGRQADISRYSMNTIVKWMNNMDHFMDRGENDFSQQHLDNLKRVIDLLSGAQMSRENFYEVMDIFGIQQAEREQMLNGF